MVKKTKKNKDILTIVDIKRKVVPILKKNGVTKAGIFGSYARGEANKKSDVDMLIKLHGKKSLLDFVGIKLELEDKLRKKVDLVEYEVIKQRIKEQILRDEVKII